MFNTISVIGLGYIGLPTAAVIASRRISVIGVDVNENIVDIINQGKAHFVEPELDIVVHATVAEGCLRAVTKPESADAFIIAVPTPVKSNHEPDLSYIEEAAKSIAPVLEQNNLVILESTSPVGATEKMAEWLADARPDLSFPQTHGELSDIRIAHCPERVLPGHVVRELVENDRVIGGVTTKCSECASRLYRLFVNAECMITDVRTAEMVKLVENSFRDVNIAFANELSVISPQIGIDVWKLIELANHHPRVNILQPGPGVGGHCIAIDPWYIVHSCPESANLISMARQVNDAKPEWVVAQVKDAERRYAKANPDVSEVKIACLGLAFKADIDDLRESPALRIVKSLCQASLGEILIVEPHIGELPASLNSYGRLVDVDLAIVESNIVVLLVDHREFRQINSDLFVNKVVIDTKGIWSVNNS